MADEQPLATKPQGSTASDVPDLAVDLPYLKRLDALREQTHGLLSSALDALCTRDPNGWEGIGLESPTTLTLLRRVKHVAWAHNRSEELLKGAFEPLPSITTIKQLFPDPSKTPPPTAVPVLFAAHYFRTRIDETVDETGAVPKGFFLAGYRILYDLYSVEHPDWALGAAQAGGPQSSASVFITAESARALGHYAHLLERSAALAENIRQIARYANVVARLRLSATAGTSLFRLPDCWCDAELSRVGERIDTIVQTQAGLVVFPLPKKEGLSPGAWTEALAKGLKSALEAELVALRSAIKEIKARRKREESESTDDPRKVLARQRDLALSGTAHYLAVNTLERHRAGIESVLKVRVDDVEHFLEAAQSFFVKAAVDTHRVLEPTRLYMTAQIDAALLGSQSSRPPVGLHDLAIAAACAGAISNDWALPAYTAALSQLVARLDDHGQFPGGPAFFIDRDGTERHSVEAHAIRAMAQLMEHTPGPADPAAVARMLTYFQRSKVPHAQGIGWRHPGTTSKAKMSLWVSAVSVLTLSRIIKMLDRKINERVGRHFTLLMPKDVSAPRIDDLMCTDIGIANEQWGNRQRLRPLVTYELEQMGRHLQATRTDIADALSSVILYGPPGTGKTTLPEALSKSTGLPLLVVTPGDFLMSGSEAVEQRARVIMAALSMLTRRIILFDELDSIVHDRGGSDSRPSSIFSFLTGGMLPKLSDLNRAAKKRHFVYMLATNYVHRLDAAAIRPGRFDHKRGVYPADLASRMSRFARVFSEWLAVREPGKPPVEAADLERRAVEFIIRTAGAPMAQLCKPGWYVAPRNGADPPKTSAWAYMLGEKDLPQPSWPMPAEGDASRDGIRKATPNGQSVMRADDSTSPFLNALEIDQAIEMAMVGAWNSGGLSLLLEQPDRTTWAGLRETALAAQAALIGRWEELRNKHRDSRLRSLASPLQRVSDLAEQE